MNIYILQLQLQVVALKSDWHTTTAYVNELYIHDYLFYRPDLMIRSVQYGGPIQK